MKGKSAFAGEVDVLADLLTRNSAEKNGAERERVIDRMAAVAISAIALINPEVIVLTGGLAEPDMHDPILERCSGLIPQQHLPRLVIRLQYQEDVFAGMTAMAMASLSGKVKLVATERLWCGPDR